LESLLLFVCIEFKVKVTDDKTEICLLQYTLTGLAHVEIFMDIAWMYYGQGKAISYNEIQSYESSSKAGRKAPS